MGTDGSIHIRAYGATHPGLTRPNNEDAVLVDPELQLFIICDGMGGHAAGEIAAKIAIENVQFTLTKRRDEILGFQPFERPPVVMVRDAIRKACAAVYHGQAEETGRRGMGTTLTMVIIIGTKAIVGHVGDSRLYLHRNAVLDQLTKDHTVIQEMLDRGESGAEIEESGYSGALTRAVGIYEDVEVDAFQFDILTGDRLLLCSDGLSSVLSNEGPLSAAVASTDFSTIPQKLIELANSQGGPDNISAIIISAEAEADQVESEERRRDDVLLQIKTLRGVSMFRDLQLEDLLEFVDRAELYMAMVGDELVVEGEQGDCMYLIIEGRCALRRQGKQLAELGQGSHFGEMALLCGSPRSATVVATEECKLLQISREDFTALITARPAMGVEVLLVLAQELSSRLVAVNEKLAAG